MLRQYASLFRAASLVAVFGVLGLTAAASAHHGGYHGGFHGYGGYYGWGHAGFYRPYYGYGFYRPYYGYGFYRPYYGYGLAGFGLGAGLGYGLGSGLGSFGLGGYGLGGYGAYLPYYGGGRGYAALGGTPGPGPYANAPAGSATTNDRPPPDNAAHLQLVVPEKAAVVFDGSNTNQTGTVREFFSPPLESGKVYTYKISVRYWDANGKPIDDTRSIRVRANDWFRIDFTRPAPPEPLPAP